MKVFIYHKIFISIFIYVISSCNSPSLFSKLTKSEQIALVFQEIENIEDTLACKNGIEKAINDYENGKLGFYFTNSRTPHFTTWLRQFEEYSGALAKSSLDMNNQEGTCYNVYMKTKLFEKFGNDLFERIDQKTDSLFVLGQGDQEEQFPYGDISNYIHCQLPNHLLSAKEKYPLIIVGYQIDEKGNAYNIAIKSTLNADSIKYNYSEEAMNLVKNLPAWEPAIVDGNPVMSRMRWYTAIHFSKERKEEFCAQTVKQELSEIVASESPEQASKEDSIQLKGNLPHEKIKEEKYKIALKKSYDSLMKAPDTKIWQLYDFTNHLILIYKKKTGKPQYFELIDKSTGDIILKEVYLKADQKREELIYIHDILKEVDAQIMSIDLTTMEKREIPFLPNISFFYPYDDVKVGAITDNKVSIELIMDND